MASTVRNRRTFLACVLLCALTWSAFWQVGRNGFVNYDDSDYITGNPHVTGGLTWGNVAWAFTTTRLSNWTPLTWLSHMLDVQFFGLHAGWHHVVSLGLHTANAVILLLLLLRLSGSLWPSFFVAAFFAVHPLHVESVAWASERKDVLSTFFFLLTICAYVRYVRERGLGVVPATEDSGGGMRAAARAAAGRGEAPGPEGAVQRRARSFYVLALALYALGLMSKPMLVTLPLLLLLLDYWPLGRFETSAVWTRTKRLIPALVDKVPFLLQAIASSMVTLMAQTRSYSMSGGLPLRLRVATAITTYLQYLGKTIWPSGLAAFYPDPNARYFAPHHTPLYPVSELWPAWQIALGALLLAAGCALVWVRRRHEPWLLTGWFWYLGLLVPVIGIVQAGTQVMADRYTYVPLIGIFIACVWTAAGLAVGHPAGRLVAGGAGAILLAGCVLATTKQVSYWHDNATLFRHALAVTTRNPMAEWMVGAACADRGQLGLAQTHFRLALEADPYRVEAHSALGSLYELENRIDLATNEYQATLRLKPDDEFARLRLAGVLRATGKPREALAEYEETGRRNPDSVEANYEAGALCLDLGDADRAARYLAAALRLQPGHADALLCLSDLRVQQGRLGEAVAALRHVVQLYPTNFELRVNLGSLLWRAGKRDQALRQYREALALSPSYPMIHYNLGTALLALGQPAEASEELSRALALRPDYFEAARDLGRALSAQRKFQEAEQAFQQALRIAATNADLHVSLGTARLLAGQTNEARAAFAKAIALQPDLAERCVAEGETMVRRGELAAALTRFETAVWLKPESPKSLRSLAWLLAANPDIGARDEARALELAQKAVQAAREDARCWAALDVAYAAAGKFTDAVRAAEHAKALAEASNDSMAAQAAEGRLHLYQQQQPFRLR